MEKLSIRPNHRLKSLSTEELVYTPPKILSIANIQNRRVISRRDLLKLGGSFLVALGVDQSFTGCEKSEKGGNSESWRVYKFQASHKGTVQSIAFSPDGTIIASASFDAIKVWNSVNGKLIFVLKVQNFGIVAFNPTGTKLAVSDGNGIYIWDSKNGSLLSIIPTSSYISQITWSNDGNKIAGFYDGGFDIYMYDVASGNLDLSITDKNVYIKSLAFSIDGSKILSGGSDAKVKIWNILNGTLIKTLEGHNDIIGAIISLPDENKFVSASWDGILKIWDINTGDLLLTCNIKDEDRSRPNYLYYPLLCSQDGNKLTLIYDYDCLGKLMIKILNINDGSIIFNTIIDANIGVPYSLMYGCIIKYGTLNPNWSQIAISTLDDPGLIQIWKSINMTAFNLEYLLIDPSLPKDASSEYVVSCKNSAPSWFPQPCFCDCVCTCDTEGLACYAYPIRICTCDLVCVCVPVYY